MSLQDYKKTPGGMSAAVAAAAAWASRIHTAMPRPLRWLTADPKRMLTLAWMIGLLIAGSARSAMANTIIVGPDLAHGGPETLFETYDFLAYKLTVKPDDTESGIFDLGTAGLEMVGFINNLIMWASLGLLYGALTLLQWFLNLTIYRDSAAQIDTATQVIATSVFWPLIGATVAVGAFLSYARWRSDGRGVLADLGWVVAAGAIAVGFASGPSTIMNEIDGVRQDMAAGVISGASQFVTTTANPAGFPAPAIGGTPQDSASRKLVDSVWSTFGVTPWCLAEFRDPNICKEAGHHALANDDQWQAWMKVLDDQGAVPEFGTQGDWIRGQDVSRTGYLLLLALLSIPMGLMLLRLVIAGLIAVVGMMLMLVVGLIFLLFWPIPGWFRQTGTRYVVYTVGLELQGLFITLVIVGDMVVVAIIATQMSKYGYFLVAVFNLAAIFAGVKARNWLDNLTSVGGSAAMGIASVLIMRSVAKTVANLGAGLATGGAATAARTAAGIGGFLNTRGRGPGWTRQPGATTLGLFRVGTVSKPRNRMTPLKAWATRDNTSTQGTLPTQPSSRTLAQKPVDRGRLLEAGPTTQYTASADQKLARNVAQEQKKARRSQRVWVDKPGSGLSPLPTGRAPKPVRRKAGVHRITQARPPRKRPGGHR